MHFSSPQTGDVNGRRLVDAHRVRVVVVVVIGGSVLIVLFFVLLRPRRLEHRSRQQGGVSGWQMRANEICSQGREVIDLTTKTQPGEPGSGLTVEQLRKVEGRVEVLIGELHDMAVTAPSELTGRFVSVATLHAHALHDLVETERRIRLATIAPNVAMLNDTARQLTQERVALDESLRDMVALATGEF